MPDNAAITLDFREHPTIVKFLRDDNFVRILIGPVGSGKTTGCCFEIWRRACEQEPAADGYRHFRAAIVRNTMNELRDTTIRTWQNMFPPDRWPGVWRISPKPRHIIEVPPTLDQPGIKLEVDFLPLDKPDDARRLLSYEGTLIYFNEVREIKRDIFEAATMRVGRFPYPKPGPPATWYGVIADTNPPDENHWIYEIDVLDRPPRYSVYKQPPGILEAKEQDHGDYKTWTSIDRDVPDVQVKDKNLVLPNAGTFWITNPKAENLPYLPHDPMHPGGRLGLAGYYLNGAAGKTRAWIQSYLQGRYAPVFAGKPVIPEFNPDIMVTDSLPVIEGLPFEGGMDVGGNTIHPAACIVQQHQGIYRVLDEVSVPEIGLDEFVVLLREHIAGLNPKGTMGPGWFGDPAGLTKDSFMRNAYQYMQTMGVYVQPAPGNNDWRQRVTAIQSPMLRSHPDQHRPCIVIHRRCTNLIKGLAGGWHYRQLQTTGADKYDPAPNKNEYSHICDALGYYLLGKKEGQKFGRMGGLKPTINNDNWSVI